MKARGRKEKETATRNRSYAPGGLVFPQIGTRLAIGFVLLAMAACSPSPAEGPWAAEDSAGITLLSGPAPTTTSVGLAAEPLLAVAEVEGLPLFRASTILPRDDGSFVVMDAGNHRLLLFDAAGELMDMTGSQGDGPGEFQRLSTASLLQDSVLVYDGRHRRVTVLGPGLERVRDQLLVGEDNLPIQFVGTFANGSWVGSMGQALTGPPPQGVLRQPVQYLALADAEPTPLGGGLGSERWVSMEMSGGQITSVNVLAYPFFRSTQIAVGGSQIVFGDTDAWVLWIHDSTGAVRKSIRLLQEPEPFGQAGIPRYVETLTDLLPAEQRTTAEALRSVDLPATLPAFSEIHLDDRERVWVRPFNLDPQAAQEWFVFGDAGAEGVLTLPEGFALKAIRAGLLYGVFKDPFDVESVQVYAIQ